MDSYRREDGRDGSVAVAYRTWTSGRAFLSWRAVKFFLKPSRNIWTQVARGAVKLNGMLC